MSDFAVKVENLGKRYRLGMFVGGGGARYATMRDSIAEAFGGMVRRKRGRAELGASESEYLWALRNLSLTINKGDVVGIIGRNGAGKSTLLKVLTRITEPTEGTAAINGRVGSLLEVGTGFHPELTGRENIFLNGAILGMKRGEIQRKFDAIVEFAEIKRFLDTPVKRYSSGMYVRLAFAVAAHLEPEILLVDEVLAVGDVSFQKKCIGRMGQVAHEGRTVFFVSHNMAAVRQLCTRAIMLDSGNVVMDGAVDKVIAYYLSKGAAANPLREWTDDATAPGNATACLRRVRVANAAGLTAGELSSDEPITIEISYNVNKDGARLGASVIVNNQEGVCVFSSIDNHQTEWHGVPRPQGVYLSALEIPKSLLPDGSFNVTVLLWEHGYTPICSVTDAVSFEIVDSGEVRGDYFRAMSGIIRPSFVWRTQKLESESPSDCGENDESSGDSCKGAQ